jgi:DNA-binding beta-propeller fold protein YncE
VKDDGTVYVLDDNSVQVFNSSGEPERTIDREQAGLSSANGICLGSDGSIYIADTAQSRVIKLPPESTGSPGSLTGKDGGQPAKLEQPVDVTLAPQDKSGKVYAIDLRDRIVQFTADGTIAQEWQVPVGREDGGSRLAISPDGSKVYMSDPERRRVAVLDVVGGQITYFGDDGTGQGQFTGPSGIAVGPDGRVYVLDRSGSVQVFTVK